MSSNFQERFRFTFLSAEVLLEGVSVANEEVNEKYNIPLGTPFASIVMLDSCKATENNTELFHIPANAHMVVLFDSVTINDTLKNKIYNLRALLHYYITLLKIESRNLKLNFPKSQTSEKSF